MSSDHSNSRQDRALPRWRTPRRLPYSRNATTRESLSAYTGIAFAPTSWFVDDQPGHASAGGCVDVRGVVNPALRLAVCGVVGISVKHGEAAWASAYLLLFSGGRRVPGPDGLGMLSLANRSEGWASLGWIADEYGEWRTHDTDARWSKDDG